MMNGRARAPDERKFVDISISKIAEDGVFEGYASLFGKVDLGQDIVEPGAFKASLERRGTRSIRMLFQHDPAEPVGAWLVLKEDRKGLHVRGRLSLSTAKGRELHALMRDGALDGLSIGFRTVRARTDAKTGVRRILELDLWEISIVTFPMLPDARVDAVKATGPGRAGGRTMKPTDPARKLAAAIRRASMKMKERNRLR